MRMPDYQVAGEGDITITLLHGGYGSKSYWRDEIKYLVDSGFRVLAWDAPGYGISRLPSGNQRSYTIEMMAAACIELVAKVGGPYNVLLGHSMGGLIAPKVCELAPELIDLLVISATVQGLGNMDADFQQAFVADRVAPLDRGMRFRDVAGPLVASMIAQGNSSAGLDLIVESAKQTPEDTFRAAIGAIVQYKGESALAAVTVPTLCIAGASDPVGKPEFMQALANNIAEARYVCVENAGHYAWAEQPEIFNRHLLDFISEHRK